MIISCNNDLCSTRNGSPLDFLFVLCTVISEEIIIDLSKIEIKNEVFTKY